MSRLRTELAVIPRAAWWIGFLLYVGCVAATWTLFLPQDEDLSGWPVVGKLAFAAIIPLFLAVYVLLIGYVNGDARRRGMRYVLWTLLAALIPNALGIILYFILRDPPMRDCPKCGAAVQGRFGFCQACGTAVSRTCPQCQGAIELGWLHCARCGTQLRTAS